MQYLIVIKNCPTIWRVSSSMISEAGINIGEALLDSVPIMVVVMLSQGGGGALVPPKSTGASWTINSLIFAVTTRVLEVEIVTAS